MLSSAQPSGNYAAFVVAAADYAKVTKVLKSTGWTALGAADRFGEIFPASKFFVCDDGTQPTSPWLEAVARGSITLATLADATLKIRAP